jgi:hypothetical protein
LLFAALRSISEDRNYGTAKNPLQPHPTQKPLFTPSFCLTLKHSTAQSLSNITRQPNTHNSL